LMGGTLPHVIRRGRQGGNSGMGNRDLARRQGDRR